MPDEQRPESPTDRDDAATADERSTDDTTAADDVAPAGTGDATPEGGPEAEPVSGKIFSVYGLVSGVLALVSVAAVVVGLLAWSTHRNDVSERTYRSRVLQTAAGWTSVLINLNAENVETGMQRLHDKTTGDLHAEFEATIQPYREVVQRIQSRSTGRIEAVAIESLPYDPDAGSAAPDAAEQRSNATGGRTDPVAVIATSIAENVGGSPQTVHWALHLNVSDVDGRLLISRLRSIR